MNGRKAANTPAATPSAMACGVERSRSARFQKYCPERANERRGHRWTRIRDSRPSRVRLENSIGSFYSFAPRPGNIAAGPAGQRLVHILVYMWRLPGFTGGILASSGGSRSAG